MQQRSIAAVLLSSSLILASCGSETSKSQRGSSKPTTAEAGFAARVETVRKQAEALATSAPGVIVSVRDGNDRKVLAIGDAARDPARKLTPEDTVMIASVTKALVATVALSLVQDGSLRLDDPVEKWLPGLLPKGRQINVEHLLSMSSGLPELRGLTRLSRTRSAATEGPGRFDRKATARLRAGNAWRAVEHQLRGAPTDP